LVPGDGSTVSGERPIGVCMYICKYVFYISMRNNREEWIV